MPGITSYGVPINYSEGPPLLCNAQPLLPPGLHESERMMLVQRWINNIPTDLPIFAQTSLNHLILLSDPKLFPDEHCSTDNQCHMDQNLEVSHYCSTAQCLSVNCPSPHRDPHRNESSSNGKAKVLFSSSPTIHCPQICAQVSQSHFVGGHWRRSNQNSSSKMIDNRLAPIGSSSAQFFNQFNFSSRNLEITASSRLFDELETHVIVKLFNDFFISGRCPSLRDVRLRIANSILQVSRNATSIRAKVKRLQISGSWSDYIKF